MSRLCRLSTLPSTCSTGCPAPSVMSESSPRRNRRSRITYIILTSCSRASPFVDHLPDLLVQLVLLPDAVSGPQQYGLDRHQPDRAADRRIDPLVAPQADAQLALPGDEDHG